MSKQKEIKSNVWCKNPKKIDYNKLKPKSKRAQILDRIRKHGQEVGWIRKKKEN